MEESKIMRVVGLASTVLYDKDDAYNPINRRISIIVMNKRTEEAIMRDGKVAEVGGGDTAQQAEQATQGAPSR
jgi:chemotaxis protein MotB